MTTENIFMMVPVDVATNGFGTIFIAERKVELIPEDDVNDPIDKKNLDNLKKARLLFTEPVYFKNDTGVLLSREEYNHILGQAILSEQLEANNACLLSMINDLNRKLEAQA